MASGCEQCLAKKSNALDALRKDDLRQLSAARSVRRWRKGETLFEEGTAINGILCIREGSCKLVKLTENGRHQTVRLAGAGELLGQRSTISGETAHLSAVALEDMRGCFIAKADVMALLETQPAFSMAVMKAICQDLRETDDVLVDMAQKTVTARLAHALLYLSARFGETPDGSLRLQLSREDLAGIVGTAVESCIRLLSGFARDGLLELDGRRIRLLDKRRLARLHG